MLILVARLVEPLRNVLGDALGRVRVTRLGEALPQAPTVLVDLADEPPDAEERALGAIRERTNAPIILIADRSTERLAVAAIKHQVADYLRTPCSVDELRASVDRYLPRSEPARALVGESDPARRLRSKIEMVGPTDSSVFLSGETGTGKELVARLLHDGGPRRSARMVCINCAAIPDTLLESELFGHERGAFTGANAARPGAFELAHGGTLFLDEIGDMSPYAQAKVLRAIEDRAIRRVGGTVEREVDIRIIAATNQDLEAQLRGGAFRSDLYFRLNVVRLRIPSLRERIEDVPMLTRHFLDALNARLGRRVEGLDGQAAGALLSHGWPGNVRELKNLIEGAVVTLRGDRITFADLPEHFLSQLGAADTDERSRILGALVETRWNKSLAARQLRWSRMTLYRKMSRHRIELPDLAKAAAEPPSAAPRTGKRRG
jgi:DNA-binding NtrC family response regulator